MKRLAALLIVLALALPANAVVSLYIDDSPAPSTVNLDIGETIQIHSSDSSVWLGYIVPADGSVGSLTNGRPGPAYVGDNGDIWPPRTPRNLVI